MIAADYAKALFELGGSQERLKTLRALLRARGHEKLLPRIFAEYEKLQLAEERRKRATAVTPESERQRVLVELYRTLIGGPTSRI